MPAGFVGYRDSQDFDMQRTAHRARFVLAEPNLLLQNAVVHISGSGRISGIEPWKNSSAKRHVSVVDWGSAVIMPGLINAHAHLELTALHEQLTRFKSFTDWISQLINRRRLWTDEDFVLSAARGARLALASGTTLVGDITSSGIGWKATAGIRLRRVVFEEVLALAPGQAGPAMRQLNPIFKQTDPNSLLVHGISPHAPYSVSAELYMRAAALARKRRMLLATHLAETRAEVRLLEDGTGEFMDFLIARDVLPEGWRPPKLSPVRFLDSMGILGPLSVLIHCNYLDQESIRTIQKAGSSVVYCPRSHAFFGHDKHPAHQLLDAGITVALGTDSLASNSSLSVFDEMRFLFKKRKDFTPEEIFQMATRNGAAALNASRVLGRLKRGYCADMAVLELPENLKSRQFLGQILEGAGECIATIVQGQTAWQKTPANKGEVY
jgi:cytosine/adenosine deaminase-related metal-dependent hydrolase